jgi:hypothetical protein
MSSINRSKDRPSGSMSGQSGANLPPVDMETEVGPGHRVLVALPFRQRPSSTSTSDRSRTPPTPSPPPPPQGVPVPSSPAYSSLEPRPGRRHESSPSSLDESRLSSETLTPPTSNETSPSSQSAGTTQQSTPSPLGATSSHALRPRTVRPRSDNNDHRSNSHCLQPQSRSSRQSISGETLVDESETPPGLGSAILLAGSTRLPQRFYEAYRYELLLRFRLALRALSQSIPIDGIPIHQWPEAAQGIIFFLDFTDERVKNALPYFRSSMSTLTPGFTTISLIGENNLASLGMPVRSDAPSQRDNATITQRAANAVANPSNPWAPGWGPQRQRQAMERSSEAYVRMSGYGQASEAGPESYVGVRRRDATRTMRLSGSEIGRASRIVPQEHWIAQGPQTMPPASRGSFRYSNRPVTGPGVSHRLLDGPSTLPMAGTAGFQQPSDTGRWYGSPPSRLTYPPSATFTPTMARPNMGGPANYAYLPGTVRPVPASASAATMARIDFGNGPDISAPIPVSGQGIRAMQRMARSGSLRGRGMARGGGTRRGRYR